MLRKGRNGTSPPALTISQAQVVRARYQTGQYTQDALAAELGVSRGTIKRAIHNPNYPREHRYVH